MLLSSAAIALCYLELFRDPDKYSLCSREESI